MEIITHLNNAKIRIEAAKAILLNNITNTNNDFNPGIVDEDKEYKYDSVDGELFIYGVHPDDVDQNSLGDCYFMASIEAIALQNPQFIENMIHDNGDGTYTVTFYEKDENGKLVPVQITVDGTEFPMNGNNPAYAGYGDKDGDAYETWPMILEKAYAEHHGSYENIEGGKAYEAMEEITGIPSTHIHPTDLTFDELQERLNNGNAISASSHKDEKKFFGLYDSLDGTNTHYYQEGGPVETQLGDIPSSEDRETNLIPSHAYVVTGAETTDGEQWVTMRNPWDWERGEIRLTHEQFQEAFKRVDINPITIPTVHTPISR